MSQRHDNLLLDRAVLIMLAVRSAFDAALVGRIIDFVSARYARVLYEAMGASSIERILRSTESLSEKLVCIHHDATTEIDSSERDLLRSTVIEATRNPVVLDAIARFNKAAVEDARPKEDIVGYVIRLLLLGRQSNADILPWKMRGDILLALFQESGHEMENHSLGPDVDLLRSKACCFPYLPSGTGPPSNHRFGILRFLQPEGESLVADYRSSVDISQGAFRTITAKRDAGDFDVFIAHNSRDKDQVRPIAAKLEEYGILPWYDEWDLRPGLPWQYCLEDKIEKIKSAAVFIGPKGIGPWEDLEIKAFIAQFVSRKCPVIPVLLPGRKRWPKLPPFLSQFHGVDFNKHYPDPIRQLVYGISGKRS